MDDAQKIKGIDTYSIFDLMGLINLSQERKEMMLLDMNTTIWNNFLAERLCYLLTAEQLEDVKNRLDNGTNIEEIINHIIQFVPNFSELLAEYTRLSKINLVKKHFLSIINDCERIYKSLTDEDNKIKIRQQRERYVTALELSNQGEWEKIINLFKSKA